MEYSYIAYTEDRQLVKGRLSATSEEVAAKLLSYGGYRVVSLKQYIPVLNTANLAATFSRVKPGELIMFCRQLALLLESGTAIVTALELLKAQVTNPLLKRVIGQVAADMSAGASLSVALSRHPRVFSSIFHRAVAAGEESGSLEVVLRQMADYMERRDATGKKIKNSLTYPVIVAIVAMIVVGILITLVLPTFTSLFAAFKVELPLPTRLLIGLTSWLNHYGAYLIAVIAMTAGLSWAYVRTPAGKYQWDKLLLGLPVVGRIILLNELSRCCRTMALLFRVGLPLPEIMAMASRSTNNKVVVEALNGIQQELIRGEGISRSMAKRKLFLPLMVQMTAVGEETGNLDKTLATVAESFETEADDKTSTAVGLIQPAMTVVIGLIVGFIAVALFSAMYGIYGQASF